MARKAKDGEQRVRGGKPKWRGLLADLSLKQRLFVMLALMVTCVALTFTQLGFLGIGLPGEYSGYAVPLLIPIALAALLLGIGLGALTGLFAGAILLFHATYLPLDFYELTFVNPASSLGMLTFAGLTLGLLFAIALRNDPKPVRRAVYIVIVCILVSAAYSISFIANAVIVMVADMAEEYAATGNTALSDEALQLQVATIVFRMGDMGDQMWADATIMAIACILVAVATSRVLRVQGSLGLRTLYGAWLFLIVLLAFQFTAAASFVTITIAERGTAYRSMQSEVEYLCNQMREADSHAESLRAFLDEIDVDGGSLDDNAVENLLNSVSYDNLLEGYTIEDDGVLLITEDMSDYDDGAYVVVLSDTERFEKYSELDEGRDIELLTAIRASLQTGELQRIVYDAVDLSGRAFSDVTSYNMNTELAYLYSQVQDSYTVTLIVNSGKVYADRSVVMLWTSLSFLVLLLVVFGVSNRLLNRLVVRRIDDTNATLARVTGGDLKARVDVRDTREFSSLSNGINETVTALEGWISEAETRMDAELATAKAIQEAALPRTFPPYPNILRFDIYATMKAAKEVGGDFYDFFLIGDDAGSEAGKLGFVIADVSGKGVPAALFMMKAKTQIRDYLESGMNVGEAVENANRQLCDGNNAGMFVTAWVGVLDYATGHVEYVNAGHNPPLLWSISGEGETGEADGATADGATGAEAAGATAAGVAGATVAEADGATGTGASEADGATADGATGAEADGATAAGVAGAEAADANGAVDTESDEAEGAPKVGDWRWLTDRSGLPLGLFDGLPYTSYSFDCNVGDQLLLYTDGVTEAMNASDEQYGEDRLMDLAQKDYVMHPRQLVAEVRRSVAEFAAGAEQSDDITILALEVGVSPEVTAAIAVPADVEQLTRVNEFIHTELDRRLCPVRVQNQLDIAVEELFVNVARYAYPDATPDNPGTARISYTYSAEPPSISVDISDEGIPYNPLDKPDAVTPDDIMDVPIGGLGILMAKNSVDDMRYERVDGSNVVTIVKKW